MEEKNDFNILRKSFCCKLKWEMHKFSYAGFQCRHRPVFLITVSLQLLIMNPDVLTQWEPPSLLHIWNIGWPLLMGWIGH